VGDATSAPGEPSRRADTLTLEPVGRTLGLDAASLDRASRSNPVTVGTVGASTGEGDARRSARYRRADEPCECEPGVPPNALPVSDGEDESAGKPRERLAAPPGGETADGEGRARDVYAAARQQRIRRHAGGRPEKHRRKRDTTRRNLLASSMNTYAVRKRKGTVSECHFFRFFS